MIDRTRLEELRAKYGKRDGSTHYPEPEVSEYWAPKVKPFVRLRKFWHCLVGAFGVVFRGRPAIFACACPGCCQTLGFCPLTHWQWVCKFDQWRAGKP